MARCPMCRSEMQEGKCTQTRRRNCPFTQELEPTTEEAEKNEE